MFHPRPHHFPLSEIRVKFYLKRTPHIYHHHHLSRKTSTVRNRHPLRIATTTCLVLLGSSGFPRPSPSQRSALWVVCPSFRYAVGTWELFGSIGHLFYEQSATHWHLSLEILWAISVNLVLLLSPPDLIVKGHIVIVILLSNRYPLWNSEGPRSKPFA